MMVCVGTVHGDLSDFNILMAEDGPVIIDFPQAIDAANNQNARKILLRDVENLQNFVSRFVPNYVRQPYAEEIWQKYEGGELTPTYVPKGRYVANTKQADTHGVKALISDADDDERMRRTARGQSLRGMQPAPPPSAPQVAKKPRPKRR